MRAVSLLGSACLPCTTAALDDLRAAYHELAVFGLRETVTVLAIPLHETAARGLPRYSIMVCLSTGEYGSWTLHPNRTLRYLGLYSISVVLHLMVDRIFCIRFASWKGWLGLNALFCLTLLLTRFTSDSHLRGFSSTPTQSVKPNHRNASERHHVCPLCGDSLYNEQPGRPMHNQPGPTTTTPNQIQLPR